MPRQESGAVEAMYRRIHPVAVQFAKFLVVGGLSFAVDYGLFLLLHRVGVQYVVASTISFSVSLVLNYVLTLRYVFEARADRNAAKEFLLYLGLNAIALGLNQLILFASVDGLDLSPALGKIVATAVVLVYNFISRKLLIERSWSRSRGTDSEGTLPIKEQTA